MKLLLALLLFISFPGKAQNKSVPVIDSKIIHVNDLLWDLKYLSKVPDVQWINQNDSIQTLLYKGVDYKGRTTQVFAYYSNPDLVAGKTASQKKFPGVVLIHGGGGKAFKQWVKKWATEGYAAIAMDLGGKGEDGKALANAGPDQTDEFKFFNIEKEQLKDMWTYQAVADCILAHSLLLSKPEVDQAKTCVTGISWGGYLTCIVASLDNRFKAAVPVYGCAYYDESDVFSAPLNRLAKENKKKWMTYFDPSAYLPFAKPQFLFLNGNKDRFYNVVPYDKTYKLVAEKQRAICIIPDMSHGHESGWEPVEIRSFFENIVNAGSPLPVVSQVTEKDTLLSISYQSPAAVSDASFYFTNDTQSTNEMRKWSMVKASIDSGNNMISCAKPKEAFKYGFFYLKDNRDLTISSEFIINK